MQTASLPANLADFMIYIWRTRRFDRTSLSVVNEGPTEESSKLDVLQFGNFNRNHETENKPTFSEGRVRVGQTVWAGDIHVSVKSSDWFTKRHAFNPEFDNVVLHVVWEHDEPVLNARGLHIPTLALKDLVPEGLYKNFETLFKQKHEILCTPFVAKTPSLVLNGWLERMMLQHVEAEANSLYDELNKTTQDWGQVFFTAIATHLLPTNAEAVRSLAEAIPYSILQRYRGDQVALEALILSSAGLLTDNYLDEYPRMLQREFEVLQKRNGLTPMDGNAWDSKGIRKDKSITLRLVQIAGLFSRKSLFSEIVDAENKKALKDLFKVEPHLYWKSHTAPDAPATSKSRILTDLEANRILTDVVVPIVFAYGRLTGKSNLEDNALNLLENLPADNTQSFREWKALGLLAENASENVALQRLKENYCKPKRCLECAIGHCILKRNLETFR